MGATATGAADVIYSCSFLAFFFFFFPMPPLVWVPLVNQPEGEFKARTDLHLGEQSRSGILSARKVRGEEKEEKKPQTVYSY